MKKLFFLFAAMCCTMVAYADGIKIDNVYYIFDEMNLKATVTWGNKNEGTTEYTGSITIPSSINYRTKEYSVTSIGANAFQYCRYLTSVTISESVTSIGESAFYGGSNLTSVNIPNGVTRIENNVFCYCSHLTSITIPSSVTSIGVKAFQNCINLASIIIPSGVTSIERGAFNSCRGLTEIYVLATTPPSLGSDAFLNVSTDIPVYVPDVETYTGWGGFTNLQNFPDISKEKEEAIADIQAFVTTEKIANVPMDKYVSLINAAVISNELKSIVDNIKAEINSFDKFTLGEWKYLLKDGAIVGGELTLTDKDLYQSDYNFTVDGSITYSRDFSEATGKWQCWYMPFDAELSVLNDAGMDAAEIAGILMNDKEETIIAFKKMTAGKLKANTPYVVRLRSDAADTSVELTFTNKAVKKSEEKSYSAMSMYETFTFTGNYSSARFDDNYTLNKSGAFQKMGEKVYLYPMRFRMKIEPRTDGPYYNPEVNAKEFVEMTVFGDDEPTGITSYENEKKNESIYNLNGQKVTSIQSGQVYIMNGKKYIAR